MKTCPLCSLPMTTLGNISGVVSCVEGIPIWHEVFVCANKHKMAVQFNVGGVGEKWVADPVHPDEGAAWLFGVVSPDRKSGFNGQCFLNTETGELWQKHDGEWINRARFRMFKLL